MSWKNPEKSLQRSESHLFWYEHGKGNKPQAAQAIDEDEEDALFEFWIERPQRTVWWFLFNTSVSKQENISQAIRTFFHRSSFYRCKHRIH